MSKSETIIASTKSTRAPNFQHSAKSRLVRVPDWPRLPAELQLYKTSRVMTDSCGFVYLTHRGEDPLICLNPDGSLHMVIGKDVLTKSAYYYQGAPMRRKNLSKRHTAFTVCALIPGATFGSRISRGIL